MVKVILESRQGNRKIGKSPIARGLSGLTPIAGAAGDRPSPEWERANTSDRPFHVTSAKVMFIATGDLAKFPSPTRERDAAAANRDGGVRPNEHLRSLR